VLDPEHTSVYEPYLDGVDSLPFAVASVRSASDAVAFAQRYGLLRTGPGAAVYREPFSEWKIATTALRDALTLYASAKAARKGDDEAAERCRAVLHGREKTISQELRTQLEESPGLTKADIMVGALLTSGISAVRTVVQPAVLVEYPEENGAMRIGTPGEFLLQPDCTTLAELAFQLTAGMVCMGVDVRACACDCGVSFVPRHGRQRYLPGHASKQRARRRRARIRTSQTRCLPP
jgi:hypothetical protein